MTLRGMLRAATIALFATAVRLAAPAQLAAQDVVCDRGDHEVRALEFRGNAAIDDGDLARRVTTTASAWLRRNLRIFGERRCLDRGELPRDLLRLKAYYRERGYYSAEVDTLVQPMGRAAVRVVFTIDEGKPTLLESYEISGLEGIRDSAAVVRNLRLRPGRPFDFRLFRADMDTIRQRLRNFGYYHTDILPAYDANRDSLVARVWLTVLPGVRARFGEPVLTITPVDDREQQVTNNVVRRVLGISPGDVYSDRAIVGAQRGLFQLGTYRHVEVVPLVDSLQPAGDSVVVLDVRLAEDYMRRLDSEYGWATLDCGRIRMQYTDLNFASSARRLDVTAQASKIGFGEPLQTDATRRMCTFGGTRSPLAVDSLYSSRLHYFGGVTLRQPRLLGTRWVPTTSVYSERRGEYLAYLRSTYMGADLSATRELADRTPLRLSYTLEYGRTEAPDAALCAIFNLCDAESRQRLGIREDATLGVAGATLARIRTDNPISPTRGFVLRGEMRTSASSLLGTSSTLFFNKVTGDGAWYQRVGPNVLAVRVRAGAVLGRQQTPGQADFVPPQERLYAGGPTSVRGFQQNELGRLVYIAAQHDADFIPVGAPEDSTYRLSVQLDSLGKPAHHPERFVPLGGNFLVVANLDYRMRDPFFFPNLLQYTVFLDAGEVWTWRGGDRGLGFEGLKWTPGVGVRVLTPVGPAQVNVGWNPYKRQEGPIFYDQRATEQGFLPLLCASPGNNITLRLRPDGKYEPASDVPAATCIDTYRPPARRGFLSRLTFTFSIGPDF